MGEKSSRHHKKISWSGSPRLPERDGPVKLPARSLKKIYRAPALAEFAFRLWKHSRQYTGRPCVGLNGTVVSRPHCEHVVIVSALE